MSEAAPPSYHPRSSVASRPVSVLPTYTLEEEAPAPPPAATSEPAAARPNIPLTPAPKEFIYEIKNIRGKPMITLTLLGDPRLGRSVPAFTEGANITGSVKLNLKSPDPIESIVIFVRGDLVTAGDEEQRLNFFRMRKYVWRPAMGDPRAPSEDGTANWEEKLHGEYHWPLSLKLPERLEASQGGGEGNRLPHTFAERFSRACTEYYLELRINRRGRFRSDDRLMTQFGFFSMQQPGRPSLLRQLAYETNAPVPTPLSDPEGWHALAPVQIRGMIFGERSVDTKCTVFLAKPLCYTRGTTIPCAMTIETADTQAADVLAAITSSALYLQRCVTCTFKGTATDFSPCGQATWWPSPDGAAAQRHQRHLMGEIHLRKDLHPSTAIKPFRVEYAVAVFPPAAVAFKPAMAGSGPLCTQPVEIVTRFAPGPRPIAATPPAYESPDAAVNRHYELSEAAPRIGLGIKLWSSGGVGG
ncbi:hypothetical protein B0H17DRAFT_1038321 [Mycena rosella]|uniref:Arrestin-like N-terminal domain-containing protein n=1 Tax=Mycena rosella TaxID=1033263 RepID=A0AAD7GUG7_MYCRO|nr:hypothetical protein B0H17DRAFT_1038321 [Mycena rosella]